MAEKSEHDGEKLVDRDDHFAGRRGVPSAHDATLDGVVAVVDLDRRVRPRNGKHGRYRYRWTQSRYHTCCANP